MSLSGIFIFILFQMHLLASEQSLLMIIGYCHAVTVGSLSVTLNLHLLSPVSIVSHLDKSVNQMSICKC